MRRRKRTEHRSQSDKKENQHDLSGGGCKEGNYHMITSAVGLLPGSTPKYQVQVAPISAEEVHEEE